MKGIKKIVKLKCLGRLFRIVNSWWMFLERFENSRGSSCAVLLFSEETGCISLSGLDILTLSRWQAEVRHALLNSPAKLWQPPLTHHRIALLLGWLTELQECPAETQKSFAYHSQHSWYKEKLYQKKRSFKVFRQSSRINSSIKKMKNFQNKWKFSSNYSFFTVRFFIQYFISTNWCLIQIPK